jgi:hypothetical protein
LLEDRKQRSLRKALAEPTPAPAGARPRTALSLRERLADRTDGTVSVGPRRSDLAKDDYVAEKTVGIVNPVRRASLRRLLETRRLERLEVVIAGVEEAASAGTIAARDLRTLTDQAYRGGTILVSAWPRTQRIPEAEAIADRLRADYALRMFGAPT